MTVIAGIDYSFCSPAISIWDTNTEFTFQNVNLFNCNSINKKLAGKYGNNIVIDRFIDYSSEEERYRNVCKWASNILITYKVEEVALEGYSFGASAGLVFNIAENGSLIKQFMNLNNIPFTVPSPSQVKKSFTGKGSAKKPDMIDEFDRLMGVRIHEIIGVKEYSKPLCDLSDALAIMMTHSYFNKGPK
jgi:Holliday junction resolvasome RuvABC endonuclease subunit